MSILCFYLFFNINSIAALALLFYIHIIFKIPVLNYILNENMVKLNIKYHQVKFNYFIVFIGGPGVHI